MKKEVILVPKDKCLLDVLSEMGERIRNSWIFLHENAYQHLLKSKGAWYSKEEHLNAKKEAYISWRAPSKYQGGAAFVEVPESKGWGKITCIKAEYICFGMATNDPEDIYFLKMDE